MTVLWIALAFVVGMAAGSMVVAAVFLAAATRATRAQQDQLAAAYRAGLGGSR